MPGTAAMRSGEQYPYAARKRRNIRTAFTTDLHAHGDADSPWQR